MSGALQRQRPDGPIEVHNKRAGGGFRVTKDILHIVHLVHIQHIAHIVQLALFQMFYILSYLFIECCRSKILKVRAPAQFSRSACETISFVTSETV